MSDLRNNLREEFKDKEYRDTYADEWLNTYIATQLKVLREQRDWSQTQMAKEVGMAQPRIAVMEDINYSSWSINTLRRVAKAHDLRLSVRFESFSSLIPEIETFSREKLKRDSFAQDRWFHDDSYVLDRRNTLNSPAIFENVDKEAPIFFTLTCGGKSPLNVTKTAEASSTKAPRYFVMNFPTLGNIPKHSTTETPYVRNTRKIG